MIQINNMKKFALMLASASLLSSVMAAPVFADTATTSTSTAPRNTVNVACIQSAIDTRDNALVSALGSYSSSATSALNTRKDALKAAWALTAAKDRRAAIKSAWKTYRSSVSTIRSDFRKAKKSAWTSFYSARKACGPQHAVEDSTTQSVDNEL